MSEWVDIRAVTLIWTSCALGSGRSASFNVKLHSACPTCFKKNYLFHLGLIFGPLVFGFHSCLKRINIFCFFPASFLFFYILKYLIKTSTPYGPFFCQFSLDAKWLD